MTIRELTRSAHENAKAKGFYDKPRNFGEQIALIHAELSEALEADRDESYCILGTEEVLETNANDYKARIKGTVEEELADVVIRVADMAAYLDIDLEAHIIAKMKFNATRENKHGRRY